MNFNLAVWIKACRVPFLTATIIPIVLGAVLAWHQSAHFFWVKFWWTLVGGILIHAGTNLANDYFDHLSGCDEANQNPTPYSGGSRVIQQGLIPARHILIAAISCFGLGGTIGFYLNFVSGQNVILLLGIMGVFLGVFYTAKPLRIGYGSFGELAVATGFGPLMVTGSYYVQAQKLSWPVFLVSLPIGILIALVLFINEFPDYQSDKAVGKRTLVVVLGKKNAVIWFHLLLLTVYLLIVFLVVFRVLPVSSLLIFFSFPLAWKAFLVSRKNFDKIYELLAANAATIGLHSLIGILLIISLVIDKILF
jgi:1,4-dihydroxy-2-naphthoate polyprenyltransferase